VDGTDQPPRCPSAHRKLAYVFLPQRAGEASTREISRRPAAVTEGEVNRADGDERATTCFPVTNGSSSCARPVAEECVEAPRPDTALNVPVAVTDLALALEARHKVSDRSTLGDPARTDWHDASAST
jgi:hypothetical protein